MYAYIRGSKNFWMVYSKIPCISAGTERDSLAAFPSLLGLDSYDTQATVNSPDVDQHINSLSIFFLTPNIHVNYI